jgi:hypothetical protein
MLDSGNLAKACCKTQVSLAKIKNASKINNIRRGCVTCYIMDDVQTTRRLASDKGKVEPENGRRKL